MHLLLEFDGCKCTRCIRDVAAPWASGQIGQSRQEVGCGGEKMSQMLKVDGALRDQEEPLEVTWYIPAMNSHGGQSLLNSLSTITLASHSSDQESLASEAAA